MQTMFILCLIKMIYWNIPYILFCSCCCFRFGFVVFWVIQFSISFTLLITSEAYMFNSNGNKRLSGCPITLLLQSCTLADLVCPSRLVTNSTMRPILQLPLGKLSFTCMTSPTFGYTSDTFLPNLSRVCDLFLKRTKYWSRLIFKNSFSVFVLFPKC